MYKRIVQTLLVAAAISGCAPLPQPASEQDKTASVAAYINCLKSADRTLDDGRSDASSVAVAIHAVCQNEEQISVDVYAQGLAPQTAEIFRSKMEANALNLPTEVVLKQRAASPPAPTEPFGNNATQTFGGAPTNLYATQPTQPFTAGATQPY